MTDATTTAPQTHPSSTGAATEGAGSAEPLRMVSFNVGDECYAVDITVVQEINRMMDLTRVPRSPEGVRGVINLRGRIVPVLDLRTVFALGSAETTDTTKIIVVEIHDRTIGFIVDAVHEVLRLEGSAIEPAPSGMNNADAGYIRGVARVDGSLVIVLELEQLIGSERIERIDAIDTTKAA